MFKELSVCHELWYNTDLRETIDKWKNLGAEILEVYYSYSKEIFEMLFLRCFVFLTKYRGLSFPSYNVKNLTNKFTLLDSFFGAWFLRKMIIDNIKGWSIKQPNHAIIRTIFNYGRDQLDINELRNPIHKFMIKEIRKVNHFRNKRPDIFELSKTHVLHKIMEGESR